MDEYLFMTMAKLKADRLKLEQEQRQQAVLQLPEEPRSRLGEREPRAWESRFSRLIWREQS